MIAVIVLSLSARHRSEARKKALAIESQKVLKSKSPYKQKLCGNLSTGEESDEVITIEAIDLEDFAKELGANR